jgi:hypothetical protein
VRCYFRHPQLFLEQHEAIYRALDWYFHIKPFTMCYWLPGTGELLLSMTKEESQSTLHYLVYKADLSCFATKFNPVVALQVSQPRKPIQTPNKLQVKPA